MPATTLGDEYGIRTGLRSRSRYAPSMQTHGQFCAVARALEILGERWSLLVVRELLLGSRRFGELQRGLPRISKTMLSARLKELESFGVIERVVTEGGPEYELTASGLELMDVVRAVGTWGQRWARWPLTDEELDIEALLFDVRRRLRHESLPKRPVVVRLELAGLPKGDLGVRHLLIRDGELSYCVENPGFDAALVISTSLRAFTAFWRGDATWLELSRRGEIRTKGPRALARSFPTWFERYLFADVAAA
jgi:DNA-binding HxlR family transcriptional regulator